jgi:hypothetical protein
MKKLILLLLVCAVLLTACTDTYDKHTAKAIFTFEIIAQDAQPSKELLSMENNTSVFHIKTAQATVGAALLELNLIEGTPAEGADFFVVNVVDSLAANDGAKWSFQINDEPTGQCVNHTVISADVAYSFVYVSN